MKIGHLPVKIFKIKNRKGHAAICDGCLTEGKSAEEAFDRMVKAVRRVTRKK
ncbi:MAG: hypothetical protein KJ880_01000 [Candidatus Omnitrophica bacterium]|nr:hypothetical protein [Candidatus Omnitrophota bacterium]MBU1869121.1 hypothetical protein [Candidatus Omnitrophota bacterium]